MPYLELKHASKRFGTHEVLTDINLAVEQGEFVAIIGYSGAGKTTLMSLILGLQFPHRGEVTLKGERVTGPGPDRGIVFQNYSLLPWLTVYENVALAVDQVFPDWSAEKRRAHIEKYIATVNLSPARNKVPGELSGGMRQRVSVARALAMQLEILLLDEPLIIIDGREINGPGPDRGIVFQSPSLLPWMTARENVMLGVEQVFFTATQEEREQIAEYYLSVVGLADAMDKRPRELSQGMRQRVGIARAFALKPKMLLLDEPFGMLDSLTRYELQQVFNELWRKEKITAMMVTHDVDEALYLSDRIVCMTDGPEATIGEILKVNFPRPRDRKSVMEHPDYYALRADLISFLEVRAHRHHAAPLLLTESDPDAPESNPTKAQPPRTAEHGPALPIAT